MLPHGGRGRTTTTALSPGAGEGALVADVDGDRSVQGGCKIGRHLATHL